MQIVSMFVRAVDSTQSQMSMKQMPEYNQPFLESILFLPDSRLSQARCHVLTQLVSGCARHGSTQSMAHACNRASSSPPALMPDIVQFCGQYDCSALYIPHLRCWAESTIMYGIGFSSHSSRTVAGNPQSFYPNAGAFSTVM